MREKISSSESSARCSDSSVCLPGQVDPKQAIVPLGCDLFWIEGRGNFDFTLKLAVIDLHRNNSHRLASVREVELLVLQGLRGFSVSSDPESPGSHGYLNLFGIDPG